MFLNYSFLHQITFQISLLQVLKFDRQSVVTNVDESRSKLEAVDREGRGSRRQRVTKAEGNKGRG